MITPDNIEKKLADFNEFFSIPHQFNINIKPLAETNPDQNSFLASIPLSFKIASEVMVLDQSAVSPLASLKHEAAQLVNFLNLQSQKINLLVSYILNQEDNEHERYQGIKFGGGGLIFETSTPYQEQTQVELKLFFPQESTAIYCYGEIIAESQSESMYQYKVVFTHIQEDDRELLVRTSLQLQAKQLQKLAQERNQQNL